MKNININRQNLKISIIKPSFNSGKHIERAIKSVIDQDYKNFEHIIIDGGSTDKTINIIKKFKHIKWVSEPDEGQADAMNKGFKKSTGNVIVYLNADDYFYPGAFSSVIDEFKKGADFVVGDVFIKSIRFNSEFVNIPRITLEGMLRHWEPNAFSHNSSGYFYTRKVQELCPFNPSNYATMDLEFLLDAASKFSFVKVEKTLGCFEDGKENKTGATQSKLDYWQPSTFPYLDKYINCLTIKEKIAYEEARQKGYAEMQGFMNYLNINSKDINTDVLPSVSVIIPTYNCEKYIGRAIDSILSQGLKKIEIIIIDDLSTDNTRDYLENNYSNNQSIKIFYQLENKKQGAARNKGLDMAKGKYVFFLDADDYLEKGALAHLISIAEEYNAEIVACGINKILENHIKNEEEYHSYAFACTGGRDALRHLSKYRIGSVVWNKLYLREFIENNKLRFIVPYWHEDVMFTTNAVYLCKKYISIKNPYYKYFQRDSSTVNSKQTDLHLKSYVKLYVDMIEFIDRIGICNDKEGEDICRNLLKSHCDNDIFPRFLNYFKTHTAEEWDYECCDACCSILGTKGYALASFLIEVMKDRKSNSVSETFEDSKISRIESIKSYFNLKKNTILNSSFGSILKKGLFYIKKIYINFCL